MLSIRCTSRTKSWRIKKDLQRITEIKPFINKYDWEEIVLKDVWKNDASATKTKRELLKKLFENKDLCKVLMPSEDSKILEFNKY